MRSTILSSDSDAVEQLQEKLATLTAQRDRMKAVNNAWRKFEKSNDASALTALGFSAEQITAMRDKIAAAYSWEKQPYVGWQLTNLGATIRSVQKRIEHLSEVQAQPERKIDTPSGIRYEDSPADNRVRLFFPSKPDAATRSKLKSNGFRWTPSLGCWQAYRNYRAEMVAREMIAPTPVIAAPDEINRGIGHDEPTPFDTPVLVTSALLSQEAEGARVCPSCGGEKLPDLGKCESCIKTSVRAYCEAL